MQANEVGLQGVCDCARGAAGEGDDSRPTRAEFVCAGERRLAAFDHVGKQRHARGEAGARRVHLRRRAQRFDEQGIHAAFEISLGAVVGYVRPDGRTEYLGCDVLLLACNGYAGNPAMVSEWLPEMREAVFAGHTGNDGSAIAWGHALGARLADLGAYQGHGSWAVPHNILITWALMTEGGIQVNRFGRRFHDETLGYSEASVEVLAQPGGIAWAVIDNRLLALDLEFPDFAAASDAGAVRHAEDASALALVIGCEPEVLGATPANTPLRPPYHAIKVTGALFHTQGGLDVSAQCRVLAQDGRPLPNLLAAGGAARGVSGQAVWGYLSGNGLLSALAGGHIAGATAAAQLQRRAMRATTPTR